MNTPKTEQKLNAILEKTYDAQKGYANAAENATDENDPNLARWFAHQGQRRTEYAAAIIGEMKNMNLEPELESSVKGDVHRGWLNFKLNFTSDEEEAILEECLRGEKAAIEEYEDVLNNSGELPPTIVSVLRTQKDEIHATVSKIKRLEDLENYQNI
ncbi:MAG: PA2169 family four-helix-bundle protein [Nonlabens sp.]